MSKTCSCHGEGGLSADPVMGVLTRPRYVPGLILEDSDLTAAVEYTRELNRLLFRSLFGCGVVCGLEVSLDEDCGLTVMVSPGLALDGCGDPIHLVDAAKIELDRKDGVLAAREAPREPPQSDFWVIACAREKNCAPRALVCDSDDLDGASQATRTRSAVEVSVSFTPPGCVCGCTHFDPKEDKERLKGRAADLIRQLDDDATDQQTRDEPVQYECGGDKYGCHLDHYTNADCPADCGCGTACACGCCVLLAWVHWVDEKNGWRVLHKGVRRFVRPCLMADPIADGRAREQEQPKGGTKDQPKGERAPEPSAPPPPPPPAPEMRALQSEAKTANAQRKRQPASRRSSGKNS